MSIAATTTPIATTLATANKWATVGLWRDLEDYLHHELTWPQFEAVQSQCSGAKFEANFGDSVQFILDRDEELHQDALGYEDYGLPMGYCSFGYAILDENIHLWYETTSGTLLCHSLAPEGQHWEVFLPKFREGGYHWKEIQYALAGRTRAMAQRWHNSHLFLDDPDSFKKRLEEVEWHNSHMVGIEGFEPMEHPATEKLRASAKAIFRALADKIAISTLGRSPSVNDEQLSTSLQDAVASMDALLAAFDGVVKASPDEGLDFDSYEYEYDLPEEE